ncbi:MAG: GDP-mannose 4,6-dehydratase [Bosea sp. (in: a-proteobacteria)]
MAVLVTGASGFVGQLLVKTLREQLPGSERLIALGHEHSDSRPKMADVEYASADLTDSAAVARIVSSAQASRVFHLAARSSVQQSLGAARSTFDVNLGGTLALAQAMRTHTPGAVMIFASTGEVYGRAFAAGVPLSEKSPVMPGNAYARSKLAAEIALEDTLADVCPVIALRLMNHTGPGQDERFVVPTFAAQIARIEAGLAAPKVSVGNLTAERDFVDVHDMLDAYLAALALADDAKGYTLFNVGAGKVRSIESVLSGLTALSSTQFTVEQDPDRMRPSDIARTLLDVSAFHTATGWTPHRDWTTTLASVLEHWRGAYSRQS